MICSDHPAQRLLGIPGDERIIRQDRLLYYLPVNDERMVCYTVDFVYATGDDAEAYRKRRQVELDLGFAPLEEMAEEVLAGRMMLEELDRSLSMYQTFRIEDYVTIVGRGVSRRARWSTWDASTCRTSSSGRYSIERSEHWRRAGP